MIEELGGAGTVTTIAIGSSGGRALRQREGETWMLVDLNKASRLEDVEYDLAVIGSGPAGMTIADRLAARNVSVCLIEAGGRDVEWRTQRLYRGDNAGHPYYRLAMCRHRMFGGSSNWWGGWLRPLDEIDYERRDWIPGSGWPIGYDTVAQFHAEAARILKVPSADLVLREWSDRLPTPLSPSGCFERAIIQFGPETNFAETYGERVLNAPNVTVLQHANATELLLEPGTARVERVAVATLKGRRAHIRARAFVLAAGGIENPRLLLNSRGARSAGLGNENDLVGRYFMEHLHVPAGHFAWSTDARAALDPPDSDGSSFRGVLTPSEHSLRTHGLSSCSIALEGPSYHTIGTPFLGWPPAVMVLPINAYRRVRRRSPRAGDAVKTWAVRAWRAARHQETLRLEREARVRAGLPQGPSLVSLYVRSEQSPNPESRVSLLDRHDELGVPLTCLNWRVTNRDLTAIVSWLGILGREISTARIGRIVPPDASWADRIIGGPHHMGTTRMSFSPRDGVVDRDCRVHSVENLYVAGSSVFTTGGHANPTFTLVALAARLAQHLQASFGA